MPHFFSAAAALCAATLCLMAALCPAAYAQEDTPTAAPFALLAEPHSEDWSAIKLDPATLGKMSYAVIGTTVRPEFTRELIRIQWRVGDPIDLFVIVPHGAVKPPVILYLYGYPADTERFYNDGWCRRATRDGFAAVGFVSALTGQRYSNRPMKEWFVSELQEALGKTTHDVQMILNYLVTRVDLAGGPFGIFGQGSGGTVALLAAAADPRLGFVEVLDPWGDWPDWLKSSPEIPEAERAAYLRPEFLRKVAPLDPVKYLPGLKTAKLRLEEVSAETITPTAAQDKLAAALPQIGDLKRYENERAHLLDYRAHGLTDWMERQMRPDAPPCAAVPAQAGEPNPAESILPSGSLRTSGTPCLNQNGNP